MKTILKPRVLGVLVSLLLLCCCGPVDPARPRLPADVPFDKAAGRGSWLKQESGVYASPKLYPEIWLDRLNAKSMASNETNIKYNAIGLRFLARHLVTLDFPKRTLYLKPTSLLPLVDKHAARQTRATAKSAYYFLRYSWGNLIFADCAVWHDGRTGWTFFP